MKRPSTRLALAAALALSIAAMGCSRDEPAPAKVATPKPAKAAQRAPTPPLTPRAEPFAPGAPPPTAPPENLVKEAMPASGPVADDVAAWKVGQEAFQHYATMNGFTDEATKSFFLKHMADNGDHYRMMMFGLLPGGPRYIAIKVYKDGRSEVLPDEM